MELSSRRTVELFAGIGGFRLAADSCLLETVWANDNCSKACEVYRSHFGSSELEEGDIRALTLRVPEHDILTAGFPCQPFSSAGKKRGLRDPRGTLFAMIIQVLARTGPEHFVLENVKRLLSMERGSHFATILTELTSLGYEVEWRLLNAMDFGIPQNRQRVAIVGRRSSGSIDPPSALLARREELRELSEHDLALLWDRRWWPGITAHGSRFPRWGIASGSSFFGADLGVFCDAIEPPALHAVLEEHVDKRFDFTEETLHRIGRSTEVGTFVQGVEILYNQNGGARMGYTVFGIDGVAPTLTATASRHYERYKIGDGYRRLTNVEYARLQGFPDDYCAAVPAFEQYPLFGNALPPVMGKWMIERVLTPPSTSQLPTASQLTIAV